jgi:glycosyltransferase involved in cell wall biosynthesis
MREWFSSTYSYQRQIEVLPNIIDNGLIDSIEAKPIRVRQASTSRFVYLPSVGTRIKGGDFTMPILLGLLQVDPALGFYIPGYVDSEYKEQLSQIRALPTVYLPGQVSHDQHISLMKSCVFGISPAIMENFSMAIFEAVYCGVPILAFDAGGNEDIIISGENGFLVPAFDIAAMIETARKLTMRSDIESFKQNVLAYTREKFNSQKILQKYLAVMEVL